MHFWKRLGLSPVRVPTTRTNAAPQDEDGAVLSALVRTLDAGDYERAAERTAEFASEDVAEMWSELTDSFGSLESVGAPTHRR